MLNRYEKAQGSILTSHLDNASMHRRWISKYNRFKIKKILWKGSIENKKDQVNLWNVKDIEYELHTKFFLTVVFPNICWKIFVDLVVIEIFVLFVIETLVAGF